jgi:hypothetical protein
MLYTYRMSHHSVSTTGEQASEIIMTQEEHQEFQNLPTLLTQWKRIQEEKQKLMEQKRIILEQISEHDTRSSAMATMIMGTMKKHSIAALDLKSSNARVLYKKVTRKAPINKKDMTKLLTEHLKSETAAKELQVFLDGKRPKKEKESLVYEKNEETK